MKIGIMQGRLTPSPDGRIQFFPKDNWENEFALAAELGFDCLEWVFESNDFHGNPLFSPRGQRKIHELSVEYGVAVFSVCADYFMDHPLHHRCPDIRRDVVEMLRRLVRHCGCLGISVILIPIIEQAEVSTAEDKALLGDSIFKLLRDIEDAGVTLGLESSLPAVEQKELVAVLGSKRVKLYYDLGNAASYGFDTAADIKSMGSLICSVHVKDKKRGGAVSVPLGTGDVDFEASFKALRDVGYQGQLILQAARGDADDVLANCRRNLQFVKEILDRIK